MLDPFTPNAASFEATLNSLSDGFWLLDADWKFIYANPEACRSTGETVDNLLGRTIWEVFPALLDTKVELELRRAAAERITLEVDNFYEPLDRWFGIKIFPVVHGGLAILSRNSTETKRFEEALRASEERFRLASDAAGACVYDVDLTGQREIIVHGLEGVTGYRPTEVGLTTDWWLSLIHPDDLPTHRTNLARHLVRGGTYSAVYRIRRKDGAWIWVEATAQVFKNDAGKAIQIVGAVVDVSQRRRAEDALRASEQNFRRLHSVSGRLLSAEELESALDDVLENAIATCGAVAGHIQLLNAGTGALEIVAHRGFAPAFLEHFREVRPSEGSACAQALQSGERMTIEDVENLPFEPHRAIAAAAGYRAVQSTPLKTHNGRVVGMLSTHFRTPRSLPETDQQHLDLYARHAADLITRLRYEQALRDAEVRKDQFLATLGHELRNPLAALKNCLELLKRSGYDAERARRALETMERQIRQMTGLVDDLLDVSRIASNKVELRMERTQLSSILHDVLEAGRPIAELAAQDLSMMQPEEPIYVLGDPVRLTQVFSNLVTNACKYTGRGGRIWLSVERRAAEAAISVNDSGVGIPPELLPKVFDLFMQVEQTLDRAKGGLGLGLPLVKRLVEMHGGSVTAHSDGPGRGSRFVVRLPVLEDVEHMAEFSDWRPLTGTCSDSKSELVESQMRSPE